MESTLLNAVLNHNKKNMVSMHMPAHKGNAESLEALGQMQNIDITEIPDTGSLFDGEGATLEAEKLAQKAFNTKATFMSAGGCTLCIQGMLRAAVPNGGRIICSRVIHRSAINTMALLGIDPAWVLPDSSAGEAFSGRVTAENVKTALEKNPDAKAVYITSPDYFGVISDVEGIAEQCKKYDIPLIVDNAHGAHFRFLEKDISPTHLGAAMSADSAHKTMPVMTGGAWLQVGDERYKDDIRQAMMLFGSTSPSYPIMISLDLARAWMEENGKEALKNLTGLVAEIKKICTDNGLILPKGFVDPARIAFDTSALGFVGEEFGEKLREHKIEPEYAGQGKIILIPSVMNTDEDFKRLNEAIIKICKERRDFQQSEKIIARLPEKIMSPRAALMSEKETLNVEASLGRIAAEVFCPCPPAIPVVMPGEIISDSEIKALLSYGIFKIKVVK